MDDNARLTAGVLPTDPFVGTTEVVAETPPLPPPLTVGVADFFASCSGSIEFVLDPFIVSKGLILLMGAPKSGKTWFAAYLAATVASLRKGPVVFVEEEGSKEVLRDRLKPFIGAVPSDMNDHLRIVFRKGIRLDSPHWIETLAGECAGAALIVLDPLAALHGQDENESAQLSRVLTAIQQLITKTGASVVLVHHTRKGGNWDTSVSTPASSADARGSGAIVAAADSIISIRALPPDKRVSGEVRFYVENTDTRVGAPFDRKLACITLGSRDGALSWVEESTSGGIAQSAEDVLSRLLAVLPSAPDDAKSRAVLRGALCIKMGRLRDAVALGIRQGFIAETRRGLYKTSLLASVPSSPQD